MTDIKNTLLIIGGSVVVVIAVIFGLTRMSSSTTSATTVDPQVLLEGARFVKENGETKVTVVAFSDIQCPACKYAKETLKELETMVGVKNVFRQFPLPPNVHKYALISAKAVEAGRVMGKGWEMMDIMFKNQEEWSDIKNPEKKFAEYAKSLGLDEKKFEETMNSKEVAELVQVDASLAARLQLSGTPTIFVNGEQVGVPFVIDKVKELLKK
ncbi:MAG: DsbA oxidoreductase [uncultured bacterium]|nr:MAG: DsbA oxidoreductase [uncultured bacterium]